MRGAALVALGLLGACHLIGGAGEYTIAQDTGGGGDQGGAGGGGAPSCEAQVDCPNGASCMDASQCASGHCSDGVCCDNACSGTCLTCAAPDHLGSCRPQEAATDPDGECAPGVCDGSGSCAVGDAGLLITLGNGSQSVFVRDAEIDSNGNIVACGRFRDPLDFGGGAVPSVAGKYDAFVAKYDSSGILNWVDTLGNGASDQFAESLSLSTSAQIALAGRFTGDIDFGAGPVSSLAGKYDGFVARYAQSGTLTGLRSFGNGANDLIIEDSTMDGDGSDIVVGRFKAPVDFGNGSVATVADRYDAFVAKYDPAGNLQWVNTFGNGLHDQHATAVAVDSRGSVSVAGRAKLEVDFGGGAIAGQGGLYDGYVVNFSATGNYVWATRFGNASFDQHVEGVAVDSRGASVVVGRAKGDVDFGAGTVAALGASYDGFIASFDDSGSPQWVRRFGDGVVDQLATAVAVDDHDNVITVGQFQGTVDFGSGSVTSGGAALDAFVVKLDRHGTPLWIRTFGNGVEDQSTASVAVGPSGASVVSGAFRGSVDFGHGAVSSVGSKDDGWILVLSP